MDMSKMVGLIVAVTVSIIVFVSVLVPIISQATGTGGALAPSGDFATWGTLVTVCGTLTVIVILMLVVRNLGKGQ